MSTLVGHALAATLATSAVRKEHEPRPRALVALAIVVALLPDLDVLVFLAARPLGMVPHRGASHTLLFAAATSAAAALVSNRALRVGLGRLWFVLALAALSHPLLDYLMGAGPPVPLLAPFSEGGYLFPWRALPTAYYGKAAGAYLTLPFWGLNAVAAALELVIFVPLVVATSRRSTARATALGICVAVCGVVVTARLYN